MQPRWNHARSTARPNASSRAQGLEGKEISSPSGRGRKMSLTSPLIDRDVSTVARELSSPTAGNPSGSSRAAKALLAIHCKRLTKFLHLDCDTMPNRSSIDDLKGLGGALRLIACCPTASHAVLCLWTTNHRPSFPASILVRTRPVLSDWVQTEALMTDEELF